VGAVVCGVVCGQVGQTALHAAAGCGYVDVVEVLLAQPGIDVNVRDKVLSRRRLRASR
jgi:hypothetical protein